MYALHIANKNYSSWSLRPWILLHELDIAFVELMHPFDSNAWQEFRQFSPTGKVPCLQHGPTLVWDSLAITEYLAERHTGVWPTDPTARAWARCASAEMHAGFEELRTICSMNCGVRMRLTSITPALQQDLDRLTELWQEGLTRFGGPFLAGDTFSAVDAFYAPVAVRIQTYALPLQPVALAYAQHLLALPSMQQWVEEALRETWRCALHEEWSSPTKGDRELVADLRQA